MTTKFSTWLNEKIAKSGLLASDVAEKSGIRRETIYYLRNGRRSPRYATVAALCGVFHENPGKVWQDVRN